ncbi:MAG: alpha/beta hydrolase [Betaproteobacteria bacterium]|nr:alpha/beta hydrolase [Betaproteobacteria bacterium]
MTPLVFVHGWGMGPDLWSPIINNLPDHPVQRADLGFRGSPARPIVSTPLVIAHSLGLMWALTHLPRPWAGLVSVNGFTRFTRADGFPGVAPRFLARMKSRLPVDATGVVDDFLCRCGMASPHTRGFDQAMLSQGLDWLAEWDTRAQFARIGCPVLAIGGTADPVVTEPHSRACFPGIPLVMVEGGGHLLPQTHAGWLASRIAATLKGDWPA